MQPTQECTLATYAEAKRLPIAFLQQLGLRDQKLGDRRVLRIPYLDTAGCEIAVRFRTAIEGSESGADKFRWKTGTRVHPYGLSRLAEARRAGHVVLVEGESDCHTLWHHGIPAVGIPGASSWKESWGDLLDDIATVFVVIEPDQGGETMLRWLQKSRISERVRLLRLDGVKDPSALHLADPEAFDAAWAAAVASAIAWTEHVRQVDGARHRDAELQCGSLSREPSILVRLSRELADSGVVGEERAAMLLYLALTTRVFDRPVSVVMKGTSSAGKSFISRTVLKFFSSTAYYELSAMSDRALAYSNEPLKNRFLVIFEAAGLQSELATYLLRSLLSEGAVRYETVEKTENGMQPRLITREGPTGLLLTTTLQHLHPENETRMLSIPISESREQTREVFRSLARANQPTPNYEPWHALQLWLEGGEHRVAVPYATALAELMSADTVRLRRDFAAILSLIRAHALLHRATRTRDDTGQIVATLEDFSVVRCLIVDLVSDVLEASVSATIRQTVAAVGELLVGGLSTVTVKQVASKLGIDKSSASRRARAALDAGFLVNEEERRGRPAKLAIGESMPPEIEILPQVCAVAAAMGCTVADPPVGVMSAGSPGDPPTTPGSSPAVSPGDAPEGSGASDDAEAPNGT